MRKQLMRYDETGGKYKARTHVLPGYGTVDMGHVTLPVMARFFSEDLAIVQKVKAFGLVRDPVQRFGSALAEHTRRFRDRALDSYSDTERKGLIDEVLRAIEARPECAPAEYCHFSKQKAFFYVDDQQIVADIFRLEDYTAALQHIEQVTGKRLSSRRRNQSTSGGRSSRRGLRRLLNLAKPEQKVSDWRVLPELTEGPVRRFVDDYYADDRHLHTSTAAPGHASAP
ncbi:hypothetical protein [Thalassorhabdomicrobium marinisediminis]|uniref:hypothetical protein n=1 Tax=Thalassorhabdomicrobium marinisediminis TaxID=2170577 RepID=UPI0011B29C57|nr:hypothetical protein [Thalassorhabdomicrobium marinisediminis]